MSKRICSIEGCEKNVTGRGWCAMHYKRWRKHGDPMAPDHRGRAGEPLEWFWEKVDKNGPLPSDDTLAAGKGPCWLWTAACQPNGYGVFTSFPFTNLSHRVSYHLAGGTLVRGMQIDHLCRVRNCVNPDHLEQVTSRVNNLRSESTAGKANRTNRCWNGHEFNEANTYWTPDGFRHCRACGAANRRRKVARDKAALHGGDHDQLHCENIG